MSKLVEAYGPLIEHGTRPDGTTYELRGDDHPMLYVYRKGGAGYVEKATQLGGMPIEQLADMLAAELPKS